MTTLPAARTRLPGPPARPAKARTGMRGRLSPRTEALAFRIWQVCEPKGWDITLDDLADRLDVAADRVLWVLRAKDWAGRIRAIMTDQKVWAIRGAPVYGGHGATVLPDFDEGAHG